jgi:hypothetical protein
VKLIVYIAGQKLAGQAGWGLPRSPVVVALIFVASERTLQYISKDDYLDMYI